MSAPQPFKDRVGPELVDALARRIASVAPGFPAEAFVARVAPVLAPLELKGRVAAIADGLHAHLPGDYRAQLTTLLALLDAQPAIAGDDWWLWPIAAFVERYGVDDPDESLAALHAITQVHTGEFAIRPLLAAHPERTLATLRAWAHDPSEHVRRLVSEGTRTRLPWATRLPAFIADPAPVLELLELLRDDPSLDVRRSVANNLNDIGKDHPELLLATLARWSDGASEERRWVIRHAARSLVKHGHPEALALLGAGAAQVELLALQVTPEAVLLGGEVLLEATLASRAEQPQRLVVDYVMRFASANGSDRRKVFKLRELQIAPGEQLTLRRRHSFRPVTVRRYYPGTQRIELQVNGVVLGSVEVLLVAPGGE